MQNHSERPTHKSSVQNVPIKNGKRAQNGLIQKGSIKKSLIQRGLIQLIQKDPIQNGKA